MDKNLLHVWYMNSLAGYSVATYIIGIDWKSCQDFKIDAVWIALRGRFSKWCSEVVLWLADAL